ncbi:MAG TPA: hypothetical protein VFU76_14965 [Terriglobales bacterium]|nr:hypothetical protein [Terriglobales bacterium]
MKSPFQVLVAFVCVFSALNGAAVAALLHGTSLRAREGILLLSAASLLVGVLNAIRGFSSSPPAA